MVVDDDSPRIGVDGVTRPARPVGRTWWILPYCAGALAVFVVAGAIIGLRHAPETARPAGLSSAAAPMPAEMFPDALFGKLTADIQDGNESAFLGLASTTARPAITAWWENLRAIGFTTGAVVPTASLDAVHLDSQGDGSAVVLAGAHSPLDPTNDVGKPDIPMAHYRIGLHFAGPGAIGQITSWQPLDDAPWDLGSPLYVAKSQYVTVAGPPAEAAAAYDIKMMSKAAPLFLWQKGFVVFVSGSATVRNSWFATDPQPDGWPPVALGAHALQLPGPGLSAYTPVKTNVSSLTDAVADDSMGGVRVILAPAGATTAHAETVTLVGEFMLDISAAQDEELANSFPLHAVPSWTQEGLAVATQSLYESNPNPVPATYSFASLSAELRALPPSYRSGVYPTSQDLFGSSATADKDWGEVAGSAYEYIYSQYNLSKMLVSGFEVALEHPTPFGNVYKSGTNARNLVFFGIHSIRLGWQPWLGRF
jgi:hypothetical protein